MTRTWAGCLVVAVSLGLACAASAPTAAGTQTGPVIALHAQTRVPKGDPCTRMEQAYSEGLTCYDFRTACETYKSYDLYIVVAAANPEAGVAFASFGILYDNGATGSSTVTNDTGVNVYDWVLCSGGTAISYPAAPSPDAFPASGSGLRLYWDAETDCQTTAPPDGKGVEVVIGCLYVYAYSRDFFLITENEHAPDGPEYLVGDCDGEQYDLSRWEWDLGAFVRFSPAAVEQGNNPCYYVHVPVRHTSWSRLKTTYE